MVHHAWEAHLSCPSPKLAEQLAYGQVLDFTQPEGPRGGPVWWQTGRSRCEVSGLLMQEMRRFI